jgi:hypothetical protein
MAGQPSGTSPRRPEGVEYREVRHDRMAGQPFGTSPRRPEGVAYREVRHDHRARPLSGDATDSVTSLARPASVPLGPVSRQRLEM